MNLISDVTTKEQLLKVSFGRENALPEICSKSSKPGCGVRLVNGILTIITASFVVKRTLSQIFKFYKKFWGVS